MLAFIFYFFVFPQVLHGSLPALDEVRTQFVQSVEDSDKAKDLYDKLDNEKASSNSLYLGYFGATEALLAKHHWNPYKKLDYLAKSQKTLQRAISKSPNNLELRFLRFSIQHYIPTFLGQSKNLAEDRDVILKELSASNYAESDKPVVKNVVNFLIQSKRCSDEQNAFLKRFVQGI